MGYRRDGKREDSRSRWKMENAALIGACGLPSDVVASEDAWRYFLAHGYNREGWWNQAPWFEPQSITDDSRREAFIDLIKSFVDALVPPQEQPPWRESLAREYHRDFGDT